MNSKFQTLLEQAHKKLIGPEENERRVDIIRRIEELYKERLPEKFTSLLSDEELQAVHDRLLAQIKSVRAAEKEWEEKY